MKAVLAWPIVFTLGGCITVTTSASRKREANEQARARLERDKAAMQRFYDVVAAHRAEDARKAQSRLIVPDPMPVAVPEPAPDTEQSPQPATGAGGAGGAGPTETELAASERERLAQERAKEEKEQAERDAYAESLDENALENGWDIDSIYARRTDLVIQYRGCSRQIAFDIARRGAARLRELGFLTVYCETSYGGQWWQDVPQP